MEYTIQKLARIAGISSRTLRYYDEIGLLKPARISSSGYRIYGKEHIDTLQQILFYRALDIPLERIRDIVNAKTFDANYALREHHKQLLARREQIDRLIDNVEKTMQTMEGRTTMSDKEKFEGFKQDLIDENEAKYGSEIRAKYGDETVNQSNQKLKNMTPEQFQQAEDLGKLIVQKLASATAKGDPASPLAQEVAALHEQWLRFYWPQYSKQAHAGVAQMYVDDQRFANYYDKEAPGAAAFLRDAIWIYTGMEK